MSESAAWTYLDIYSRFERETTWQKREQEEDAHNPLPPNRLRKFGFPNRLGDDSIAHVNELETLRVRGADRQTAGMFSYISLEGLVPQNHPLRAIRPLVNAALQRLSPEFDKIYAPGGRESIAPERLLRALLLQALFSVRSERQLMEQRSPTT